ncbi:hypothetical protein IWZ03DRAFT_111793 [Phyllosticta citriasiana]|uniref:Uncharacterized protein n=1 Tax=Phyllosticta citriasiana TaxID=595635 RepID=A0ABR1KVP6_9PEZI
MGGSGRSAVAVRPTRTYRHHLTVHHSTGTAPFQLGARGLGEVSCMDASLFLFPSLTATSSPVQSSPVQSSPVQKHNRYSCPTAFPPSAQFRIPYPHTPCVSFAYTRSRTSWCLTALLVANELAREHTTRRPILLESRAPSSRSVVRLLLRSCPTIATILRRHTDPNTLRHHPRAIHHHHLQLLLRLRLRLAHPQDHHLDTRQHILSKSGRAAAPAAPVAPAAAAAAATTGAKATRAVTGTPTRNMSFGSARCGASAGGKVRRQGHHLQTIHTANQYTRRSATSNRGARASCLGRAAGAGWKTSMTMSLVHGKAFGRPR